MKSRKYLHFDEYKNARIGPLGEYNENNLVLLVFVWFLISEGNGVFLFLGGYDHISV